MHKAKRLVRIEDLIGQYSKLERVSRRDLKCRCLLHDDRVASMYVNTDKQVWYCHVCAVGGDAIEFFRRVEGMSFKEAVEELERQGRNNGKTSDV